MPRVGSFAIPTYLLAFQYSMEVLSKCSTVVERMDSRVRLPGLVSCLHFFEHVIWSLEASVYSCAKRGK